MHVDRIKNDWANEEQVLLDRLPADTPIEESSYVFMFGPHTDDECPFRGGPRIPFVPVG